ncbi:MAG: hypothetical protein JNJ53_14310, partial [Rhizobiales bacterium]|nr:hypothetical protein [Hyphomicrobiales bacterium]
GLAGEGAVERLSRPVYRYALRQLRKAESAARRLIYAAARNIVLEPEELRPARPRQKPSTQPKADGAAGANVESNGQDEAKATRKRRPLFSLFDPARRLRKLFGRRPKRKRAEPRIHFFDYDPRIPWLLRQPTAAPTAPAPVEEDIADDGMVDARKLIRRFIALTDALQDIPRQAMRLAHWQARPKEERRPSRWSPLRSGRPPGYRERPRHEIDEILKDCDWLARNVMPPLDDTS